MIAEASEHVPPLVYAVGGLSVLGIIFFVWDAWKNDR